MPVSFVGILGHKNNPNRRPFLARVAAAGCTLVAERHSALALARTLTALLRQVREAEIWRLRLKEKHEVCRWTVRTAFGMLRES